MSRDDLPVATCTWALFEIQAPEGQLRAHALGGEVRIFGREPGADPHSVTLHDTTVSRQHAQVQMAPNGAIRLEDLDSTNGTTVNGLRVGRAVLHQGDVVRMGDTLFVLDTLPEARGPVGRLLGESDSMCGLRAMAHRVAPSALPALIWGPTGTGKELVAQSIHERSGRGGPLIVVNSAALPPALVESTLFGHRQGAFTDAKSDAAGAFVDADGGTLFLDEIGEMPLDVQPKLLRALESGEITPVGASRARRVDVRLVAATHRDLIAAVDEGEFREDLYARIAGVVLRPPALAERKVDILALLHHCLPAPARQRPWTADFAEALLMYRWPRNVRELKMLAQRLAVLYPDASAWGVEMLDGPMRPGAEITAGAAAVDHLTWPPSREKLVDLLALCGGNVSDLADRVGRNRKQIYRWMDKLGIERGTGRP